MSESLGSVRTVLAFNAAARTAEEYDEVCNHRVLAVRPLYRRATSQGSRGSTQRHKNDLLPQRLQLGNLFGCSQMHHRRCEARWYYHPGEAVPKLHDSLQT